jgi:hypothetical protein
MLAVVGGYVSAVQALRAKGADIGAKNNAGQSALTLAQGRGLADMLQAPSQGKGPTAPDVVRFPDTSPPRITLLEPAGLRNTRSATTVTPEIRLVGTVTDEAGVAKFSINGKPVPLDSQGHFSHSVESSLIVKRDIPQPQAPTPKGAPTVGFGHYHALVIGNNAYAHLLPLETAVNDAKAVADLLSHAYGFNVVLLLDATREAIVIALDKLRAMLTEQDNLLIYYAGHGVLDKEAERGYWLPVDAHEDTRANWLATITITDTLKAMTAKHALVVSDSCYAGTL